MEKSSVFGNWRALVVNNKDPQKFGRVMVWIPDLMPEVSNKQGIWARPANNPLGGRNMEASSDHHFMGTSYIPKNGSWVFIFFEGGNINRPYYFGALDLENTTVLPENQVGTEYENKWTILKSHEGRAIVVSDDPYDARTEITGKKRKITNPPSGDITSVYQIDTNQTTILFDERDGMEKILIRTYKGDFLHIDIDERKLQIEFWNDIEIKAYGNINITAGDSINLKALGGDTNIQSDVGNINIKGAGDVNLESDADMNLKTQNNLKYKAGGDIDGLAGGNMNHDATKLEEQSGKAKPAFGAGNATEADPKGERDT